MTAGCPCLPPCSTTSLPVWLRGRHFCQTPTHLQTHPPTNPPTCPSLWPTIQVANWKGSQTKIWRNFSQMCKRSLDVYSANLFAFINVGHKNLNGCLFGTKLAEKHSDARMVEPAPKKQRRVTEFFFLKSLKGKAQNYKLAKLRSCVCVWGSGFLRGQKWQEASS